MNRKKLLFTVLLIFIVLLCITSCSDNPCAAGHIFNDGEIVEEATCQYDGIKRYTCLSCGQTISKSYSKPVFTANEIYNQSIKYVGEIVTYKRNGDEYSLGTGFVISSDGKIVTIITLFTGRILRRLP